MPNLIPTPSTATPSIVLHGRRPRLSPAQARVLAALLARPGQLVAESELLLPGDRRRLLRLVSRIRPVIEPHGLAIYRVPQRGFVLLAPAQEGEP